MNDQAKPLSRAVFGNAYMLSIANAIAGFADGTFTQRNIGAKLAIPDNLVSGPLRKLAAAQLIKERDQGWERIDSVLWELVVTFYGEQIGVTE